MQDSEMVIVNGQQGSSGDENLYVKFEMRPVKNNFKSEKEGRPIFEDKLYVSILSPGSLLSRIERQASDMDKQRFPKQYMSFQNNQHAETTGTPVDQWPALTRTQVEELRAMKFYSVEQISAASDTQLGSLPQGFELRTKAKAYLVNAKDSAAAQKLAADNERLENDNKLLKEQVRDLASRIEAVEGGVKRGPGRPRKAVVTQ